MSKMPLEWHEECHRNHTASLKRDQEDLARLRFRVERSEEELCFYGKQIAAAKAKGADGFDRDRFLRGERKCYLLP